MDEDSDNDGIRDVTEMGNNPNLDTDSDGTPDHLDLDSDGDGIADVIEANGTDADKDGRADGAVNSKGIPASAAGGLTPPDTDGDGKRDFQDVDSDADGIPDNREGQSGTYKAPSGKDTDKDGIDDAYDKDNGGTPITPVDTDADGRPDYRDVDSDGDGIPDSVERGPNGNAPLDTDGDGTPDYRDLDSDNDGIPDSIERGPNGNTPLDTDGDGTPDYRDLDSDNDGIPDSVEKGPNGNSPLDTDGDGTPDYRDLDSDNDGIPDIDERGSDGSRPVDSDGDGIPDYRDIDSDNNGIPDGETLLIHKTATKPALATDGTFSFTYTITLRNARKEPINNVQVVEDLSRTFPTPMQFTVTDVKSNGVLTKATGFDGRTNTNLLASGVTLAGNAIDSILVTVRLAPNGFSGDVSNTATGTAVTKWFNVTRQSIDITRSGGRLHGTGLPTISAIPLVNSFVADVLTPNNDGYNDKWIILRPSNVKVGVTIFNRWGQVVYKNADYKNDWDGRSTNGFSGNMLPAGTYYYVVELSGGNITSKDIRKGYITLIRN